MLAGKNIGKHKWRQCRFQTAIVHYTRWITEIEQRIATLDGLNMSLRRLFQTCSIQTSTATWSTFPRSSLESVWKSTRARGTHIDAIWLRDEYSVGVYRQKITSSSLKGYVSALARATGSVMVLIVMLTCTPVCVRGLPRVNHVGTVCRCVSMISSKCCEISVTVKLCPFVPDWSGIPEHNSYPPAVGSCQSFKQRAFLPVWRCFVFDRSLPG